MVKKTKFSRLNQTFCQSYPLTFGEVKRGRLSWWLHQRRKLLEFGGHIKRTAENIQLQRSNLYKKLDRYGLK